jgi:hypothetical protein
MSIKNKYQKRKLRQRKGFDLLPFAMRREIEVFFGEVVAEKSEKIRQNDGKFRQNIDCSTNLSKL